MNRLQFDIAHLLAGSLVLISFVMLYQDRLYALLNVYAAHAFALALSVAWQAFIQGAPHLYLTAIIALVFKAIVVPVALHRIIVRLGIHREIETAVGKIEHPCRVLWRARERAVLRTAHDEQPLQGAAEHERLVAREARR